MINKRKAYEERLDAQLAEWNAEIALLKAKADKANAETRLAYYRTIETLQHKQDEAGSKLRELKSAGDEAWDELKAGAEEAWDEIKAAFNGAAERFK